MFRATPTSSNWLLALRQPESFILRTQFFINYFKSPRVVGSVVPSSQFLAKAMCRHAQGAQHIIELGAGTGAVTKQLANSFPNKSIVVVERDTRMAEALRRAFPKCQVVADEVQTQTGLFENIPLKTVVVSSLPFRSLPPSVAEKIGAMLQKFLLESPQRKLVQFSYGQKVPFPSPHAGLLWKREKLVLLNVPPAWVWTLQAEEQKYVESLVE